jgi:hypothetical protein
MGLLDWLGRKRRSQRTASSNDAGTTRGVSFEGGGGDTVESAIVVRGARHDLEGTYAEFAWLAHEYGQKDEHWKLVSRSHGRHGSREIDTFHIELSDGTALTVFFDCTESFGN